MDRVFTESELRDPNLDNEIISKLFYEGQWSVIKNLKLNPKFKIEKEEIWIIMSKDYDFFWTPWYPVIFFLMVMATNLYFNFFPQFFSLFFAVFGLIYIKFIIPFLNKIKEENRIRFLDEILEGSPYHRSLYEEKLPN